jgi:hypothetical protein
METRKKRAYERPAITRIKLDARCAVLGFCKVQHIGGPTGNACRHGNTPCSAPGS